jgi:cbb3-type cytochrome oxidase subunit 3
MIENTLRSLGGVGLYGIISICLFFGFFICMLFWASRLKKPYLNSMQSLPLNEERENVAPAAEKPVKPDTIYERR